MKARDLNGNHDAVLHLAKVAQRAAIKHWMVNNYVGGRKELAEWNDDRYSYCGFYTTGVMKAGKDEADVHKRRNWSTTGTPLRYLKDLVTAGFLTTDQSREGGIHSFRFNRATCDALAAEVRAELIAEGIKPRNEA